MQKRRTPLIRSSTWKVATTRCDAQTADDDNGRGRLLMMPSNDNNDHLHRICTIKLRRRRRRRLKSIISQPAAVVIGGPVASLRQLDDHCLGKTPALVRGSIAFLSNLSKCSRVPSDWRYWTGLEASSSLHTRF